MELRVLRVLRDLKVLKDNRGNKDLQDRSAPWGLRDCKVLKGAKVNQGCRALLESMDPLDRLAQRDRLETPPGRAMNSKPEPSWTLELSW
jgi:hypothetical protein